MWSNSYSCSHLESQDHIEYYRIMNGYWCAGLDRINQNTLEFLHGLPFLGPSRKGNWPGAYNSSKTLKPTRTHHPMSWLSANRVPYHHLRTFPCWHTILCVRLGVRQTVTNLNLNPFRRKSWTRLREMNTIPKNMAGDARLCVPIISASDSTKDHQGNVGHPARCPL